MADVTETAQAGRWWYILDWQNRAGIWIAYDKAENIAHLRPSIETLDRLGYDRTRRRVRHYREETVE